jgi:CHASE3 domain sensor protein
MPEILSMKTFLKLEDKLGTEAAKEVYQLAEAIYEEVEKKAEEMLGQYQLRIKESGENSATKGDLTDFRKELNTTLMTLFEERVGDLKDKLRQHRKAFQRVTLLLIVNIIILLILSGYVIIPLI